MHAYMYKNHYETDSSDRFETRCSMFNGGCRYLCLPTPTGRTCACPRSRSPVFRLVDRAINTSCYIDDSKHSLSLMTKTLLLYYNHFITKIIILNYTKLLPYDS